MKNSIHRLMTDGCNGILPQITQKAFWEVSAALDFITYGLGSETTTTIVIARDDDLVVGNVSDSDALYVSDRRIVQNGLPPLPIG